MLDDARISISSNPGRMHTVTSDRGVRLLLQCREPATISVDTFVVPPKLTSREAEAIMRAFATMLGYEIGERHEV